MLTASHIASQGPPILRPCTWMKKDKFFYIDCTAPHLVLYTDACGYDVLNNPHGEFGAFKKAPNFVEPSDWTSIMHQTAGYACHSYFIHAKFLKPRVNIYPLFEKLLNRFNDSCVCRVASLKTVNEYETILNEYNLTSNNSYPYLEEGFYPIDIECLKTLTSQRFPKNLQNLIIKNEKEKPLARLLNHVNFKLAILGPNCD